MKIIFIHHSSFAVCMEEHILIFDYFSKDKMPDCNFSGIFPDFPEDAKLYFFSSHKQIDHFDMDNYRFKEKYKNAKYIISKDAKLSPNNLKKHGLDFVNKDFVTYVSAGEKYEIDGMTIKTFKSTDSGVAFLIEVEGKTIYHAGDLNDWVWEGAGELVNGKMTSEYRHQINKLSAVNIDIAFVPIDSRQEQHMYKGIDYFMNNVNAKHVFPMHFWHKYEVIDDYISRISNGAFADRIVRVHNENEVFEEDCFK